MASKIVRENGTIIDGVKSVVYKEQVNSDTDLRPGCVASASIEVEVYGGQEGAVESGETLRYYQVGSDGKETLFGIFYAETTIQTRNMYKFTAYDSVSKLDVDFSGRLTAIQNNFPMTLSVLVREACSVAGVTLTGSFPMSTTQINAFYADGISCRQVLSWAAEIACRFVRCDTEGNIKFDWYSAVNEYRITPSDGGTDDEAYIYYKQDGLHYENYETSALARVAIHPTDEEQIAYIYPTSAKSGNTLDITNNILLTGADETVYMSVARNIYNTISALGKYRPAQIDLFPFNNPFRAGMLVKVTDIQNVSFVTAVMSMSIQDDVAKLSSSGNESYSDSQNTLKETLINLADNLVRIKNLKADKADIGSAVIQYLEATKIDADSITVKDANGNVIFVADVDSKTVQFGGSTASNGTINGGTIRGSTFISQDADGNTVDISNGEIRVTSYDDLNDRDVVVSIGGSDSAGVYIGVDDGESVDYTMSLIPGEIELRGDIIVDGDITSEGKLEASEVVSLGDVRLPNNGTLRLIDSAMEIGDTPDSTHYGGGLRLYDANGYIVGALQTYYTTSGALGIRLRSLRGSLDNTIALTINDSGVAGVTLSQPAAWLSALGTIPINRGGTGNTGLVSVTPTVSSVTNVSNVSVTVRRWGKVAFVTLSFQLGALIENWTNLMTGLPAAAVEWIDTATEYTNAAARNCRVRVNTSGALAIRYGGVGTYSISMTYPIS